MEEAIKKDLDLTCLRVPVESIYNLRHVILRPGLPVETAHFDGDMKSDTYHFACFLLKRGPDPLCCVSYYKNEYDALPAFQLRGMATRKDFQGKKLGSTLVTYAEKLILKETGISRFWCNAREKAVPFYLKQGWATCGEYFVMPGVGKHIVMTKGIAPF